MTKPNQYSYHVGGPWRPTVKDAVTAFVEQLKRKGHDLCVFQFPFVGVRATVQEQIETKVRSDGKGILYRVGTEFNQQIPPLLIAQGLNVQEETT